MTNTITRTAAPRKRKIEPLKRGCVYQGLFDWLCVNDADDPGNPPYLVALHSGAVWLFGSGGDIPGFVPFGLTIAPVGSVVAIIVGD